MTDQQQVVIRYTKLEDTQAIVRLLHQWAAAYDEQSPITADYLSDYLAAPCTRVLVAECEGSVVGLLSYTVRPSLYHASPSCLIEEFVVDEAVRGKGIGSLLLKEIVRQTQAEGCAEISVSVMRENRKAIKLYRAHGFDGDALLLEMHF